MSNKLLPYIFLIINILFYILCFIFIIKRKGYAAITLRSPVLLLIHNISGLFTSILFYIKLIIDNSETQIIPESPRNHYYYLSSSYYLFQIIMVGSFILSYQRIIYCSKIEVQPQSSNNKIKYKQTFYIRFIIIFFIIIITIIIILNILLKHPFTLNILDGNNRNNMQSSSYFISQSNVWICVNLCENIIILTYAYFICIIHTHLKIKFEIITFALLWFVYSICISLYELYFINKFKQETLVIFSLIYLFICLLLNGFFPIILSFYSGNEIGYNFNSDLTNDLYLFLSNENCYGAFYNYVRENVYNQLYLKIFTQIMSVKLLEINQANMDNIIKLSNSVLKTLNDNNNNFNDEKLHSIINDIRNTIGNEINKLNYQTNLFDMLLRIVFDKLNIVFREFKKQKEFKELINEINYNSYIKGKIINKGLGGKY